MQEKRKTPRRSKDWAGDLIDLSEVFDTQTFFSYNSSSQTYSLQFNDRSYGENIPPEAVGRIEFISVNGTAEDKKWVRDTLLPNLDEKSSGPSLYRGLLKRLEKRTPGYSSPDVG